MKKTAIDKIRTLIIKDGITAFEMLRLLESVSSERAEEAERLDLPIAANYRQQEAEAIKQALRTIYIRGSEVQRGTIVAEIGE